MAWLDRIVLVAPFVVACGPGTADGSGGGSGSSEGGETSTGDTADPGSDESTATGVEPIDYEDVIEPGPDLQHARYGHVAVLLQDGRVLVAGGYDGAASVLASELYDPVAAAIAPAGELARDRFNACAVLLPDGRVLIVGDESTTELWDPATELWSPGPPLEAAAGANPMCGLAGDGSVFVADSYVRGKGFLFERWVAGDPEFARMPGETDLVYAGGHDATVVGDSQRVLLLGGFVEFIGEPPPDSDPGGAQVYDLTAGEFRRIDGWAEQGRALALADGDAVVFRPTPEAFTAARFSASNEAFADISPTGEWASSDAVAMRTDGQIILAGGRDEVSAIDGVRRWDIDARVVESVATLTVARSHATATRLADGRIVIIGGTADARAALPTIDIYR